jgi:hypothetical protein
MKAFTADDLISAPRPQAPIPNQEGTQAISVVDKWDPVKDKWVFGDTHMS